MEYGNYLPIIDEDVISLSRHVEFTCRNIHTLTYLPLKVAKPLISQMSILPSFDFLTALLVFD